MLSFSKVDLLATLHVEGIIIWNWSEILMVQNEDAVVERIYLMGAKGFVVYHGDDLNNLTKYEVVSKIIQTSDSN